ncbi:hypothetical protein MHBO_002335 [Bonamia ostreae]|uniref:Major facilitator superfamily (MFS) profile domain-containing protein n=1 Tax=Bonamia ostreae TaxID=126728 RepID=A0ABV2AM31_9EUKA
MPKMDKTEERAYYVLVMSRGPFLMTTLAILFPIILDLAKFNRSKDGYVHLGVLSITPANFVFVVNSITSFIVIVLSPLIGSISDINNNRKKIVVAMSLAFMIVSFSSFFLLSKKLWLFCALIQITLISIFELTNVIYNAIMASIG